MTETSRFPSFTREWRKHRKLTLEQLAEKIEVDHATIIKWEKGQRQPSAENLQALISALGVSVYQLLEVKPSKLSDDSGMPGAVNRFVGELPENHLEDDKHVIEGDPPVNVGGELDEMATADPVVYEVRQIKHAQEEHSERFEQVAERYGSRMDELTDAVHELIREIRKERNARNNK